MSTSYLTRLVALILAAWIVGCGSAGGGAGGQGGTKSDTASGSSHSHDRDGRQAEDLKPRMIFPDITVRSQEGEEITTGSLIYGRDTIAIFVQIGCDACSDVMKVWAENKDQIPPELNVIAFAEDEPEYVKQYAEETNFPFPLYCDEWGVFALDYNMDMYPSMIGIRKDGAIAYVGKPVTPEFTPARAWNLLNQVKQGHEGER